MNFLILTVFAFVLGAATADNKLGFLFKLCSFDAQGAAEQAAIASNNFAVRLYREITKANPSKNVVFSPASISLALALIETGANGTTLKEMQNALRPPGSSDLDSSKLYQTLQSELHAGNGDSYKINVANGLFYAEKLKFRPYYVDKMKLCFHTEVAKAPFEQDYEGARKQINNWVSDATVGKIPELFKPGTITPDVLAAVANAIYFKGAWIDKFEKFEDRIFYKFGQADDVQNVQFLARNDNYNYGSTQYADVIQIPYERHLFTMYIILPKQRDGIKQVEQNFGGNMLSSLKLQTRRVELKIPKFTTRLSFDLKKLLEQVGQREMFSDKADFSRMSDGFLKVSSAVHEAFIKVNENGTEAAAASAFEFMLGMSMEEEQPPISFIADHPFMFAIVHEPTKAIVFMGKINFLEKDEGS